jgi:hypothetical protein
LHLVRVYVTHSFSPDAYVYVVLDSHDECNVRTLATPLLEDTGSAEPDGCTPLLQVASTLTQEEQPDLDSPFRAEALRERERAAGVEAEPLRLEPAWTRRASWLVILMFSALVLALLLGSARLLSFVPALKGMAR